MSSADPSQVPSPLPPTGRLAGIDYGMVRVGVATCDPSRQFCGPYEVYNRRTAALDARWFQQMVKDEGVVGFVVGLPLHTSGEESGQSREARAFAQWLAETTGLPVDLHDERYTSHAAEQMLAATELTKKRRKQRLDALAAQLILEAYLQRMGSQGV
jgi:putative holliday junction resolvase